MTPPREAALADAASETDRLVADAYARINALKDLLAGQLRPSDASDGAGPPGLPMLAAIQVMAQSTLADAQTDAYRRTLEAESLAGRIRSGQVRPGEATGLGPSAPRPTDTTQVLGNSGVPQTSRAAPSAWSLSAEKLQAIGGIGLVAFALLVAGFAAFLVTLTGTSHERSQRALFASFQRQAASGRAPTGGTMRVGAPVSLIEIPRLHLREVVVEGTSSAELAKGPGHLRTSPLPGQVGNAVLFGRRSLYGGPFANIGSLRAGDRILTTTGQGKATYSVTQIDHVHSGSNDVIDATGDNRLTLLTADPAWVPSQRLAVTAMLQTTPHAAPAGRPTQLNADEMGTSGDNLAASSLLAWALLLLLVSLGATWLYLRWATWSTWLITTPVLLALLFLFYESLTRLLPATL